MLAFDVETVGQTEAELDPETLAFLKKNPDKAADNLDRTALSPYTGFVACIAAGTPWRTRASSS